MKLFHLSDLHIGLKLYNRDLNEDHRYIFRQIAERAGEEKPDVILIAGDIYDKAVPSAEAMEIFDEFINLLFDAVPDVKIMAISGNHDSAPRVNTYRNILAKKGLYMIGNPPSREEDHIEQVELIDEYGPVSFYLLPFVKPSMIKAITGEQEDGRLLSYNDAVHKLIDREAIDSERRNVLVSHQFYIPSGKNADEIERMDSEIYTVGNIDSVNGDILDRFDYAALGHIHKPMHLGSEHLRYSGTPLACSVSEAGQTKGIIVVELLEKGRVDTNVIPLGPLHQVRKIKGLYEEILSRTSDDYVSIELTDKEDLPVIDMQDRLRNAFPNLLEIRRNYQREANYDREIFHREDNDPLAICCAFCPDITDEETEILRDIINTVKGAD